MATAEAIEDIRSEIISLTQRVETLEGAAEGRSKTETKPRLGHRRVTTHRRITESASAFYVDRFGIRFKRFEDMPDDYYGKIIRGYAKELEARDLASVGAWPTKTVVEAMIDSHTLHGQEKAGRFWSKLIRGTSFKELHDLLRVANTGRNSGDAHGIYIARRHLKAKIQAAAEEFPG